MSKELNKEMLVALLHLVNERKAVHRFFFDQMQMTASHGGIRSTQVMAMASVLIEEIGALQAAFPQVNDGIVQLSEEMKRQVISDGNLFTKIEQLEKRIAELEAKNKET